MLVGRIRLKFTKYVGVPWRVSSDKGDTSRFRLLEEASRLLLSARCRSLGDRCSVGVSEYASDGGVSMSGVKELDGTALGGRAGRLLSNTGAAPLTPLGACLLVFAFFRLLAIKLSWQLMQKIPCDVLA